MKYQIVSIEEACRVERGWTYNDEHIVGSLDLDLDPTPRNIFKVLREIGVLSEYSKGRVTMEDYCYPTLVIMDRRTYEPLYKLRPIEDC